MYGRESLTKTCIQGLLNEFKDHHFHGVAFNLVVIDDSDCPFVEQTFGPTTGLEVYRGTGDLWWSGSLNLGVRLMSRPPGLIGVVLWNNDLVARDDYWDKMALNVIRSKQPLMVFGSCIYDLEDNLWSGGGRWKPWTGVRFMLKQETTAQRWEVDWLPGMGTFVSVDVLNELVWDDKHFPQYHGDSDFVLRAKDRGIKPFVCSDLKIWNDTALTGYKADSLADYWESINPKNLRSSYNIKKDIMFTSRHGVGPFKYLGVIKRLIILLRNIMK